MWALLARMGGAAVGAFVGGLVAAVTVGPLIFMLGLILHPVVAGILFLLVVVTGAGIIGLWGWILTDERLSPEPTECLQCRYNLHGVTGRTCPECGHPISPEQQKLLTTEATEPAIG